jgi:hypothetical protein
MPMRAALTVVGLVMGCFGSMKKNRNESLLPFGAGMCKTHPAQQTNTGDNG